MAATSRAKSGLRINRIRREEPTQTHALTLRREGRNGNTEIILEMQLKLELVALSQSLHCARPSHSQENYCARRTARRGTRAQRKMAQPEFPDAEYSTRGTTSCLMNLLTCFDRQHDSIIIDNLSVHQFCALFSLPIDSNSCCARQLVDSAIFCTLEARVVKFKLNFTTLCMIKLLLSGNCCNTLSCQLPSIMRQICLAMLLALLHRPARVSPQVMITRL
jgi:hypothetical protein